MQVDTRAYGLIEVDERQKINFPKGLFGFEDLHEFVLLDSNQEPFFWLQSLERKDLAFILISPFIFRPDFCIQTAAGDLEAVGIETINDPDTLVFAIVTIPEDNSQMSANLQGPVVINRKTRTACQVISLDSKWKVKHFILQEMAGSPSC